MNTKESETPVDLSYVHNISDGDDELTGEMLSAFVMDADEGLETLRKSCATGNAEGWRNAAHALKGALRHSARDFSLGSFR